MSDQSPPRKKTKTSNAPLEPQAAGPLTPIEDDESISHHAPPLEPDDESANVSHYAPPCLSPSLLTADSDAMEIDSGAMEALSLSAIDTKLEHLKYIPSIEGREEFLRSLLPPDHPVLQLPSLTLEEGEEPVDQDFMDRKSVFAPCHKWATVQRGQVLVRHLMDFHPGGAILAVFPTQLRAARFVESLSTQLWNTREYHETLLAVEATAQYFQKDSQKATVIAMKGHGTIMQESGNRILQMLKERFQELTVGTGLSLNDFTVSLEYENMKVLRGSGVVRTLHEDLDGPLQAADPKALSELLDVVRPSFEKILRAHLPGLHKPWLNLSYAIQVSTTMYFSKFDIKNGASFSSKDTFRHLSRLRAFLYGVTVTENPGTGLALIPLHLADEIWRHALLLVSTTPFLKSPAVLSLVPPALVIKSLTAQTVEKHIIWHIIKLITVVHHQFAILSDHTLKSTDSTDARIECIQFFAKMQKYLCPQCSRRIEVTKSNLPGPTGRSDGTHPDQLTWFTSYARTDILCAAVYETLYSKMGQAGIELDWEYPDQLFTCLVFLSGKRLSEETLAAFVGFVKITHANCKWERDVKRGVNGMLYDSDQPKQLNKCNSLPTDRK